MKTSWKNDNILRRVLRNSGFLFSSNVLSAVAGFIQGILVVRLIGIENYGLLAGTVFLFVTNINRLLSFRMSEVVVKYLGEALAKGDKDRAAILVKGMGSIEITTSILAYIVLLILSPWAAQTFAKDLSAVFLFQTYGIYLLGNLVFETSTGVLQTFKRFDRISKAQSSGTIFTAVAIGAIFFLRGNFFHILTAYLAGKLLAGFLAGLFAAYELNHNLGAGWLWTRAADGDRSPFLIAGWRGLLTFAFNTNLNGTVNLIMRDSAPLFLSVFATQSEVGYFKLAHSLVVTLIMVPIEPFIWPTYSEINETILHAQWQSTKRLLRRVSIIAAVWTVGAGAVLTAFGWWLIPFIYGADTAPAYPASVILLLGFGFANILHWNRPLLLAFGNPSLPLIVSALVGAVQIALIFILVPYFGYIGMSWLMTGYFIVSIGIIVWMGLSEIRKREASQ